FFAVPTRAIAVEQTHNRAGGAVIALSTLERLRAVADAAGVGLHCDGARIWHAHVADGVPLATYGGLFDTLSVCLSKGLGAPVGSLVVSNAERIDRARWIRKRMGGGMRQAGVLAAAGRYALANHVQRLADDHARAARLAVALEPYGVVNAKAVRTNIVPLDLAEAGLSTTTGTPAVAGCASSSANASGPSVPAPTDSCRSRVDPQPSFESLACTSHSRSGPTASTRASSVAAVPPGLARSCPAAQAWQ